MVGNLIERKECTKCHILKDMCEFGVRKDRKSGYRSSCKECEKEMTKKWVKKNNTFDIVGCSPIFLKEHIEKKFTEGMSWSNRGLFGWHIDHIIPLSSAKTEEEIYKLCHYTNLQPLWVKDNLKKGKTLNNYGR
jgi:hypothetical protein